MVKEGSNREVEYHVGPEYRERFGAYRVTAWVPEHDALVAGFGDTLLEAYTDALRMVGIYRRTKKAIDALP